MDAERRRAIKEFVAHWSAYGGNEIQGTVQFWTEFAGKVLGASEPTRVFEFERKVQGRRIDAFIEDTGVLIEQKAPGVDPDKAEQRGRHEGGDKRMVTPYEQAKWYAEKLPHAVSPRWLLTSNFRTIRVYDLDEEDPQKDFLEVSLKDLPRKADVFSFMVSKANGRGLRTFSVPRLPGRGSSCAVADPSTPAPPWGAPRRGSEDIHQAWSRAPRAWRPRRSRRSSPEGRRTCRRA